MVHKLSLAGVDIEDCVSTDWLVSACSDMFEYLEDRNRHHALRKINYRKPAPRKRALKVV